MQPITRSGPKPAQLAIIVCMAAIVCSACARAEPAPAPQTPPSATPDANSANAKPTTLTPAASTNPAQPEQNAPKQTSPETAALEQTSPEKTPPVRAMPDRPDRPIGRVWGVQAVTSGTGPRGLHPSWDNPSGSAGTAGNARDWSAEFAVAVANLVTPYGPPPDATRPGTVANATGFDEIIIYRPWGIEDHTNKAMLFDALERARDRVAELAPGTPGATAVRRMIDVNTFEAAARAAQQRFGKPFWYYLGQCNDPALERRLPEEIDDYAILSAEPILAVGGNIFIDDSGSKDRNSTAWRVAQSLKRLGVARVGYEPAAHTIQPTNNAALSGGQTLLTPWAYEPEMVGMITGPLWKNRIEWQPPAELNAKERDRNSRAWMVPLRHTAGEVVIWGYAPEQQDKDWIVGRLAEGWSVVIGADFLQKHRLTPQDLRTAAAAKRASNARGR